MSGQIAVVYSWATRRTRDEALRMLRKRFCVASVTHDDAARAERDPKKWKDSHRPLDIKSAGL